MVVEATAAAEVAHSSGVETERVSLVDAAAVAEACSSSLAASWSSLECPLSLEVSLSLSESSDDSDFFSFFSSSSSTSASALGGPLLLVLVVVVVVMETPPPPPAETLLELAAAAAAIMC